MRTGNAYLINSASKSIRSAIDDLNESFKHSPLHEIIIAMSEYDECGSYIISSSNLNYNNKALFSILNHLQNVAEQNQFMPFKSDIYFSIKEGFKFYKHSNFRFRSILDDFTDKMYESKLFDFFAQYVFIAELVPVEIHNIECYNIKFDKLLEYSNLMKGREKIKQFMRSLGDQANDERRDTLMNVMVNGIKDSPVYITTDEGEVIHISYLSRNYDYQRITGALINWLCMENNFQMEIKKDD